MASILGSLCFLKLLFVTLIYLALAQNENQFVYHGFNESKLHLDGLAEIHLNGLLQLTNGTQLETGHSFYPFPFKFNTSSYQSLSFSTHFVFAIAPVNDSGGHGMAFVISSSMDFTSAFATEYLGLVNSSNNGLKSNESAPAGYFSDEGKNIKPGSTKWKSSTDLRRVAAPIRIPKPSRPFLSTPLDLSQIFLGFYIYACFYASTAILASNH